MAHVLTLRVETRQGVLHVLECTEPETAPCRQVADAGECSIVEAFQWDSFASMEGYHGPSFDACKAAIHVTEITDEGEFAWELAGHEPMDVPATHE